MPFSKAINRCSIFANRANAVLIGVSGQSCDVGSVAMQCRNALGFRFSGLSRLRFMIVVATNCSTLSQFKEVT